MKSVYKIFAVILVAGLTAMSCDKKPINEDIPVVNPEGGDNGSEQEAGTRIITLSFNTKATRTVLGEDYTPKFSDGDMIAVAKVTDQSDIQHCKVSVNPTTGIATTVTKFDGECKAVYPAKYAKIIDGELTFIVPSEQTGKFEDANICTADIPEGKNPVAEFENQTAVFEIDIPEAWDARCVTVTSLRSIFDEQDFDDIPPTGQRYTIDDEINYNKIDPGWVFYSLICNGLWNYEEEKYDVITDDTYEKGRYITIGTSHVQNPPVIKGKCYVSVLTDDDVLLRDLNFDVQNHIYEFTYQEEEDGKPVTKTSYDSGAGYMGGFSPLFLNATFGEGSVDEVTALKGAIYTGVADHLHEYVNGGNVKWATQNIGASSTSDSGLFFGWGATTGHEYNASSKKFEPISDDSGYAFTWDGIPFGDSETAVEKLEEICYAIRGTNGKTSYTLPLEYDAAYKNWGGAWRMPRISDQSGFSADLQRTSNYGVSSTRGVLSFLPAGHSDIYVGNSLTSETTATFWTSSFDKTNNTRAFYLTYTKTGVNFSSSSLTNNGGTRWVGHVIRPVSGQENQ